MQYKDPDAGCGHADMERVLVEYAIVTSLSETYSGAGGGGGVPADVTPEALEFAADHFGLELKLALSCLILERGSKEGHSLNRLIADVVDAMKKRLGLTAKYFQCLEREKEMEMELSSSYRSGLDYYHDDEWNNVFSRYY